MPVNLPNLHFNGTNEQWEVPDECLKVGTQESIFPGDRRVVEADSLGSHPIYVALRDQWNQEEEVTKEKPKFAKALRCSDTNVEMSVHEVRNNSRSEEGVNGDAAAGPSCSHALDQAADRGSSAPNKDGGHGWTSAETITGGAGDPDNKTWAEFRRLITEKNAETDATKQLRIAVGGGLRPRSEGPSEHPSSSTANHHHLLDPEKFKHLVGDAARIAKQIELAVLINRNRKCGGATGILLSGGTGLGKTSAVCVITESAMNNYDHLGVV